MMKNSACIVLLCLVTACAQSEREASIDSTESYPVIEAMVEVPAGNFWMGCNLDIDAECNVEREAPMREVQLRSFEIDVYEVTAGDYRACVVAGACVLATGDENSYSNYAMDRNDHPMNFVTWDEASTYCAWRGKRLPTEAEWEKAARGADGRKYPWGEDERSCDFAVMNDSGIGCGTGQTWPVGQKPMGMSIYGVHDLIGNVAEWTSDWFDGEYYRIAPQIDPAGPSEGNMKVVRGGSFLNPEEYLRAANRLEYQPDTRASLFGFRCARSL
ncbi:MAG: SUMF1/EgtB/PvdO family nonheme iron enzyme [Myxococcota bacterium]|nr:SUMF1/EgtB/PvdO family nonheme iron enzyme [Myxococcota bacterium]